jgi:flagella basal body P-ring formation protein FlgA
MTKNAWMPFLLLVFAFLCVYHCVAFSQSTPSRNSSALIKNAIERYAQEKYKNSIVRVEVIFAPQDLDIRDEKLFVSTRKTGDITGKTFFSINYTDANNNVRSQQVCAIVRRYERVPVLTRDVDRFYKLQQEDIKLELREALWSERDAPVTMDWAIGKRTKRELMKGRMLTRSMLEEAPAVCRGQKVNMHVYAKNLSLSLEAVACQNGSIGDEIRVRLPSNGHYFKAIIKDEKNVIKKL